MATIDLTLNSFVVPRMDTFTPPWGTVQADPDHPGLSTREAVSNIMMAFNRMRPITVTENSATTEVQADASLVLAGGITSLTLGQGAYKGVELKIAHDAAAAAVQILNGSKTMAAGRGDYLDLRWNGTEWRVKTGKFVGDIIVQHPSELSPEDRLLEGNWVQWSDRASLYALGDTAPSAGFIADWETYRYDVWGLNTDNAYITNEDVGNKKYTKPAGYTCVARQDIQADWGAADLTEGTQVTIGGNIKYIWQAISFAGIFWGVEGGNRPTFISGGVQGDRGRRIVGAINASNIGNYNSGNTGTGCVSIKSNTGANSGVNNGNPYYGNSISIDSGLVVPTGPENTPVNGAVRIWRRLPDPA